MKIKYLGHSSFYMQGNTIHGGKVKVVTDPFDPKMVGIPYPKQEVDIVTSSHEGHGDHDWYDGIKGESFKDYFTVNTPGEYEFKGLRIYGIKSFHDDSEGSKRGPNNIYIYDFIEARIAHLGDLGHELNSDQLEALEFVDILMIPVGGVYTIDPKTAIQVIESIEPKVVFPMHYKTDKHNSAFNELSTLEDFIKEYGSAEIPEPQDFYEVKSKNDLNFEETKIIPLKINN